MLCKLFSAIARSIAVIVIFYEMVLSRREWDELNRARSNDQALSVLVLLGGGITDEDIPSVRIALRSNTHVTEVNLSSPMLSHVGCIGFLDILASRPSIKTFELYCGAITHEQGDGVTFQERVPGSSFISALANKWCGLEKLSMNNVSLTETHGAFWMQMLNIQKLKECSYLSNNPAVISSPPEWLATLSADYLKQQNATLTYLRFYHYKMGDRGAEALASALLVNTTLQTLILWNCGLQDAGVASIVRSLEENSSLVELDIWRSGMQYITTEGAYEIGQLLPHARGLKQLVFSQVTNVSSGPGLVAFQSLLRGVLSNTNVVNDNWLRFDYRTTIGPSLGHSQLIEHFLGEGHQAFLKMEGDSKGRMSQLWSNFLEGVNKRAAIRSREGTTTVNAGVIYFYIRNYPVTWKHAGTFNEESAGT